MHTENMRRAIHACQGAVMVLAGYDAMQLSGDMAAPFLQEANFWWLTGIEEPGWKVIVEGPRARMTLVRPMRSDVQALFEGGLDDERVLQVSGAQRIIREDELEHELSQLARTHPRVLTVTNKQEGMHVNPAQAQLRAVLERVFERVESCNRQFAELRAIKQPVELDRVKRAVSVSVKAYQAVRANWDAYKYEYEVEADFTFAFQKDGRYGHAYAPIVASGPRACTLHYGSNAERVSKRSATVVDIGARVDGYCADITRTYCTNPTKRVVEVHRAVQQAQRQIIDLLSPGLPVMDYIKQSDTIMQAAVMSLGLMKDSQDTASYRKYFPHAVSHGLGVDVHDSLGAPRYFKAGMLLTVEPGIYIPEEGIGVRIEDDILITETGYDNLSGDLSTDL